MQPIPCPDCAGPMVDRGGANKFVEILDVDNPAMNFTGDGSTMVEEHFMQCPACKTVIYAHTL